MSLLVVLNLLLLFVVGIVSDSLNTYYIRLVAENRCFLAAFVNFIHSLVGWCIWIWFMYQFQNAETLSAIQTVFYSVGGAVGTYIGLMRKPTPA